MSLREREGEQFLTNFCRMHQILWSNRVLDYLGVSSLRQGVYKRAVNAKRERGKKRDYESPRSFASYQFAKPNSVAEELFGHHLGENDGVSPGNI